MKRLIVTLIFVFFAISNANIYAEEYQFNSRYPKDDVLKYEQVIKEVRIGRFQDAEEISDTIIDQELKWMALYYLAADGYAVSGDMENGIAIINQVTDIIRTVSNIDKYEDNDIRGQMLEALDVLYQKFLADLAVAAVESGVNQETELKEGDAIEDAILILGNLNRLYYRLMMIEKIVLRFSGKSAVDKFLLDFRVGYRIDLEIRSDNRILTMYKGIDTLVVKYQKKDGVWKVLSTYHLLGLTRRQEWLESR